MRRYTTIQGDTFDGIAFRVYENKGGEKLTSTLIEANPEHISKVIFPAGIVLNVPEVYYPASKSLPPWVR